MSNFKKYNKIQTPTSLVVGKIKFEGLDEGPWVVSEKLDGANLSFICDIEDDFKVTVASRNGPCDDTFYGAGSVFEEMKPKIESFARSMAGTIPASSIIVFGELFGQGVQKRVNYGEKRFVAFDVFVNLHPNELRLDSFYMRKSTLEAMLSIHGIPCVEFTIYNTLEDCLALEVEEVNSSYSESCDIDAHIEGYVLAPDNTKFFANGKRVILKHKSSAFLDKESSRTKNPKKYEPDTPEVEAAKNAIAVYVSENRWCDLESKYGPGEPSDIGKYIGYLSRDALEDIEEECEEYLSLDKEDQAKCRKFLSSLCADLTRKNILS